MDKPNYVHKRKKRYMAQCLAEVERILGAPGVTEADGWPVTALVPRDTADEIKAIIRRKFHALAVDTCEIITLKPGEELNGAMVDLRDRLHIEGRPIRRRTTT